MKNMLHDHGVCARMSRSPSPRRRVAIRMSANARSAVASVRTPGVFVTTTPRPAHAGTSMLSYPTAAFATMRSPGPAASRNASSTRSWRSVTTPSAPATASCSSPVSSGRSWGESQTSPAAWRSSIAGSGIRLVTTIRAATG